MKKLLLAVALFLSPASAWAQCTGIFAPNTLCGNTSGSPAPPAQVSASSAIIGPGTSTVGDLATWANTTGSQLADTPPAAFTRTNDTNITATLGGAPNTALVQAMSITFGWSGTLAAGRLNANVVQAITNDTNITGSITAQDLTLGWTGTLAAGRLNANVVQGFTNDTNVTASITAQTATLGWTGTLAVARGGTGAGTQSAAATNILPTATRAGDVLYWDGSIWNHLAGNNSGTQFLQETSSGVPSWATVSGTGTVTTLTAASGIAFSSGATCVTSCTVSNTGVLSFSYGTTASTGAMAVSLNTASNILSGNISLSSIGVYVDGPSMAQGTSGTWAVTGSVNVEDTAGAANIICKLWDGTSVIGAGTRRISVAGEIGSLSLSGNITSPAANIRISCFDGTSTHGLILFNATGTSADAYIYGTRIQ